MSITGDIYNTEQSITGIGVDTLYLSSLSTGSIINTNGGFYVNPIRQDTNNVSKTLYFDTTNNQITYNTSPSVTNGTNGISILYVGVYSSTTTYFLNNVVYFAGQSYLAIQNNFSNQPTSNTSFWALLVMKGADGPQGPQGPQGSKGDQGDSGDSSAATAAAVTAAGAAGLAAASAAAAEIAATASAASAATAMAAAEAAEVSAEAAQTTADEALKNSLYFYTSATNLNTEYCKATIQVKDSNNINTVSKLDQAGNLEVSNSISINPSGTANTFLVDSVGNVTCNNLTTNQINPSSQVLNIGSSIANNNYTINIGKTGFFNTIDIGNVSTIINLNGIVNINTNDVFKIGSFMNQVGF